MVQIDSQLTFYSIVIKTTFGQGLFFEEESNAIVIPSPEKVS